MATKGVTIEDMDARRKEIDAEIHRLQVEGDRLQIEREMLDNLAAKAYPFDNGRVRISPADSTPKTKVVRVSLGTGCTPAIRALVQNEPGLTITEIADRLEHQINTTSGNPRRLIQNTTISLVKRHHLRKTPNGRIHPLKEDE